MAHRSIVCCAVSGSVPEEPVVNRNNGQLFEKRLVEKHVKVHLLFSAPLYTSIQGWLEPVKQWHSPHPEP